MTGVENRPTHRCRCTAPHAPLSFAGMPGISPVVPWNPPTVPGISPIVPDEPSSNPRNPLDTTRVAWWQTRSAKALSTRSARTQDPMGAKPGTIGEYPDPVVEPAGVVDASVPPMGVGRALL
ncbi:hypothetical protein EEB19_23240 [Gordonia sp. OPL2]|nr:hypothetical protein EEB19_23240 [Gordonia sp. OPL2]